MHEDEARPIALPLLIQLLLARLLLWARFEQMEVWPELEPDDETEMNDDRQQYAFTSRDGAADDELILVPFVEVEMYQ